MSTYAPPLAELARRFGMSPARVCSGFRLQFGESTSEFVRRRRMDVARELLHLRTVTHDLEGLDRAALGGDLRERLVDLAAMVAVRDRNHVETRTRLRRDERPGGLDRIAARVRLTVRDHDDRGLAHARGLNRRGCAARRAAVDHHVVLGDWLCPGDFGEVSNGDDQREPAKHGEPPQVPASMIRLSPTVLV